MARATKTKDKPNISSKGMKNPASKPTPISLRAPPSFTKAKTLPPMVNNNPPHIGIAGLKSEPHALINTTMIGKVAPIRRPISVSINGEFFSLTIHSLEVH